MPVLRLHAGARPLPVGLQDAVRGDHGEVVSLLIKHGGQVGHFWQSTAAWGASCTLTGSCEPPAGRAQDPYASPGCSTVLAERRVRTGCRQLVSGSCGASPYSGRCHAPCTNVSARMCVRVCLSNAPVPTPCPTPCPDTLSAYIPLSSQTTAPWLPCPAGHGQGRPPDRPG